jgi:endoglucanase
VATDRDKNSGDSTRISPNGFSSDWTEFKPDKNLVPSAPGSYDAIRVYLWAGMLDPSTPGTDEILRALPGMARYLHSNAVPPAKIKVDGSIADARGPVGFSGALIPYLSALGEQNLQNAQMSRLQAEFNTKSGLYGNPARYYDQNLILFAPGWKAHQFWFDGQGGLQTAGISIEDRDPSGSAGLTAFVIQQTCQRGLVLL